jgi:hypothetical protein
MSVQHAEAPESAEPARPMRWWQRVVPVSAVAVLAALAVVALLGQDDQIALSTKRQPQEYVELVLSRGHATVCGPRAAQVDFAVTSHLVGTQDLRWQVAVDPAGAAPARTKQGSVSVPPEVTRGVRLRMKAPRKAYDLTVTLPGRPELLRVHCEGARR